MFSLIKKSRLVLSVCSINKQFLQEVTPLVLPSITYPLIHTSCKSYEIRKEAKAIAVVKTFENINDKRKDVYLDLLRQHIKDNPLRRGHVEFILLALKHMETFDAHKNLECYKAILDVFPKGPMIPINKYQVMMFHYPKQQQTAVEVLEQMEHNHVIPDRETEILLLSIFGAHGLPLKKYWRMMYWMPKFKHVNPWGTPDSYSPDPKWLGRFAIEKITSVDVQTEISEFDTKDVEESIDDTWIFSGMSPLQEELLNIHPIKNPVFVEGPAKVWVESHAIDYFVLRADPVQKEKIWMDPDDVSDLRVKFWDKKQVASPRTLHEQDDGTYYAACATGTSTKDSLLSWIRCLQVKNPILKKIPIVFKLKSSTKERLYLDEMKQKILHKEKIAA